MISPLCRIQLLSALFVLGAVLTAFGEATPDPWLIVATGETGRLNVKTTKADLVRIFGASKVSDRDIELGEGETAPGTVVFPKDPKRLIEIIWKYSVLKQEPKSITIHGEASRWKAVHDISLGTSLKELESLNGKPFHLAGFAWDYSGTVMSWDGGDLEWALEGRGRVILRLGGSSANSEVTAKESNEVSGDRSFSSHHPVMQKLNPTVYEMVWIFP
jgi:hypothetical protein